MNQPSQFQLQHPLSRKKFWKKILQNIITILIYSAVLDMLIWTVAIRNYSSPETLIWCGVPIFAFIFVCYAWYVSAYIKNYYYDCGDNIITIKKKVFTPTEIHVQYQKIQDVYVDQDLLDRILKIYDVHIASATFSSGLEAHIDGVDQDIAENIKNFLLTKVQNKPASETQSEKAMEQKSQSSAQTKAMQNKSANPTTSLTPKNMNEKISSHNYPISDKWMIVAIFNSIFVSIYFTFLLGIILYRPLIALITSYTDSYGDSGSIWLAVGVLFIAIFIISVIRLAIWKKNFYFELTPDYVLRKTSVLGTQETHLPYKSIQDIILRQSFVEKLFGLGTIVIQNAAYSMGGRGARGMRSAGVTIVGQPYDKAEKLKDILNEIVKNQANPQSMGM